MGRQGAFVTGPSSHYHPSSTGIRLHVRCWTAAGRPRGVLLVSHGAGEHGGTYQRLAERAAAAGFTVHAPDHRGHGATEVPGAPPGTFARRGGADLTVADLASLMAELAARHPDLPLVAFGNGMGASLVLAAAASRPCPPPGALALWNGYFALGWQGRVGRAITLVERFRRGSDAASRVGLAATHQAAAPPTVGVTRDLLGLVACIESDALLAPLDRTMPIQLAGGRDVHRFARRLERLGFRALDKIPATCHWQDPERDDHVDELVAFLDAASAREPR